MGICDFPTTLWSDVKWVPKVFKTTNKWINRQVIKRTKLCLFEVKFEVRRQNHLVGWLYSYSAWAQCKNNWSAALDFSKWNGERKRQREREQLGHRRDEEMRICVRTFSVSNHGPAWRPLDFNRTSSLPLFKQLLWTVWAALHSTSGLLGTSIFP